MPLQAHGHGVASKRPALANGKRDVSQLHVIVCRLFGIKADHDVLPNLLLWRELEMGTAKGERLPGLWV
jgi:hypothetical protein